MDEKQQPLSYSAVTGWGPKKWHFNLPTIRVPRASFMRHSCAYFKSEFEAIRNDEQVPKAVKVHRQFPSHRARPALMEYCNCGLAKDLVSSNVNQPSTDFPRILRCATAELHRKRIQLSRRGGRTDTNARTSIGEYNGCELLLMAVRCFARSKHRTKRHMAHVLDKVLLVRRIMYHTRTTRWGRVIDKRRSSPKPSDQARSYLEKQKRLL